MIGIIEIQQAVAREFEIPLAAMRGASRRRPLARPRQVAMYLSKQLTRRSLPEIGNAFGGRDHTTILHGIRMIQGMIESDPGLAERVEKLRRELVPERPAE